jgi:hypothetical protein
MYKTRKIRNSYDEDDTEIGTPQKLPQGASIDPFWTKQITMGDRFDLLRLVIGVGSWDYG